MSKFPLLIIVLLTTTSVGASRGLPDRDIPGSELDPEAVLTVAVASNFLRTAQSISAAFGRKTGIEVRLSSGSTGKLYAQLINGAPYDVFLAADRERPERLADANLVFDGTVRPYVRGRLLLVSYAENVEDDQCAAAAVRAGSGHLAIANPATAPYGRAAREYLERVGLWAALQDRIVVGENINQAFQFTITGNATYGIVARSQPAAVPGTPPSCAAGVPADAHAPVEQYLAVMRRSRWPQEAMAFADFLQGELAARIMADSGYELAPF